MIVVCGEALIDFTPVSIEGKMAYVPRPGGSPYNVAIGLARLGTNAAFLGGISGDSFGRILHQILVDNGVNDGLIVKSDLPTTLAFIHLKEGNEPEFAFYNTGTADRELLPEHIPTELPLKTRAMHFGSISTVLEPSASTLEALMRRESARRVISFDPNVRPAIMGDQERYVARIERLVSCASIVKVSNADLRWLYPTKIIEDIAESWLDMGAELVFVTLGENGAAAFSRSTQVRVSGRPVKVADTVGAGDAFTSGLLARLDSRRLLDVDALRNISKGELQDSLEFAIHAASITCERVGADPPRLDELEKAES